MSKTFRLLFKHLCLLVNFVNREVEKEEYCGILIFIYLKIKFIQWFSPMLTCLDYFRPMLTRFERVVSVELWCREFERSITSLSSSHNKTRATFAPASFVFGWLDISETSCFTMKEYTLGNWSVKSKIYV